MYRGYNTYAAPDRTVVGDVDGSGLNDLVFASPYHRDSRDRDGAIFVIPDLQM